MEELATCVAATVMRERVRSAPEPLVLRDKQDDPTAGSQRAAHPHERALVVVQVLEDVQRADDVELVVEGQLADVEPTELCLRYALARDAQTLLEEIDADGRTWGYASRMPDNTKPLPQPTSSTLVAWGKYRRRIATIRRLRARNQKLRGSACDRRSNSSAS
jgi:hypothetical protein